MEDSEWLDELSVVLALYAVRELVEDCRRHILSFLPGRVLTRCSSCACPLVASDAHGRLHLSPLTRFSLSMCTFCHFREP